MILGYRDLLNAWKKGQIKFDPDIEEGQIGLSSIDLRLGYVFTKHRDAAGHIIDPLANGFEPSNITETYTLPPIDPLGQPATYVLKPRGFILGRTLEKVYMPKNMADLQYEGTAIRVVTHPNLLKWDGVRWQPKRAMTHRPMNMIEARITQASAG